MWRIADEFILSSAKFALKLSKGKENAGPGVWFGREGQEDISKWDLSFQSNLHEIHISACISF